MSEESKVSKVFPLRVYFNKITGQVVGPLGSVNYLVIADRDKALPPPINGLPEGVEQRFADLIVYEKEEVKKEEKKEDGQDKSIN